VGARLLVLNAGSGAGNNLIRSLKSGDASLFIAGCHDDGFVIKKSLADSNYTVPGRAERGFLQALRRIIREEQIDLVIPTSDADVLAIAKLRGRLPCRVFLPRLTVIRRCQDKYALTTFLRRRRIPAPLTYPVTSIAGVNALFRRFASRKRLWCRIRHGTGSFGAIPVTTAEQVRGWIRYFKEMRGVSPRSFTLSEYLPGRDFCVQCLWRDGELILAKVAERITYIDSGSPSGVSSTPALARTAFEPQAIEACTRAIRALDPKACGIYFADIKENAAGEPCITEINAGRFATITNIHDLAGEHNMAALYVRAALDEKIKLDSPYDFAEDCYLVRSVDTQPEVLRLDELFEGVVDYS
jgi:glutathione synthase/RimK-type ligase-like ATP-grasp enzyme